MTITTDILAALATVTVALFGLLVWVLRLEGKVNLHATLFEQNTLAHKDIKEDLMYIRGRIDAAINRLPDA